MDTRTKLLNIWAGLVNLAPEDGPVRASMLAHAASLRAIIDEQPPKFIPVEPRKGILYPDEAREEQFQQSLRDAGWNDCLKAVSERGQDLIVLGYVSVLDTRSARQSGRLAYRIKPNHEPGLLTLYADSPPCGGHLTECPRCPNDVSKCPKT